MRDVVKVICQRCGVDMSEVSSGVENAVHIRGLCRAVSWNDDGRTVVEHGLLCDWQIRQLSVLRGMIEPFEPVQVTSRPFVVCGEVERVDPVISYGLSSMGYDVRCGLRWKLFTDVRGAVVDPKQPSEDCFWDLSIPEGGRVVLPPNSYALTHSVEHFRMPKNVLGLCLGKSTYARVGVHVNVTPLEPGWEGQVTIEVSNATRLPVVLYAGEGIMQVLFFSGSAPETDYEKRQGKYQGQEGVTPARVRG